MSQQKREPQNKPVKSLSARNFYKINHNREHSNKHHHTLQTEPSYNPKVKQFSHSKAENKSSRNLPFRTKQISFLQPQQLYTQNINLKGKVNKLTQQLMLQRVKHTQDTKHLIKMKKEVEVQFEDDKYIDMSRTQSKLIEGVKHQYQKMKQKYEDKCKEYNELLKRYEVSGGEQYRFQCEALQLDNKKLRNRFQILLATHQNIQRENQKQKLKQGQGEEEQAPSSRQSRESYQKRVLELLGYSSRFVCLQKKVEILQARAKQQKIRISYLKESIELKNKKISYLSKLLITKDNQIHQTVLKQRKVSKQSKQLSFRLEQLQTQLKNIRQVHQQEIIMVKQKQKVKFQTQKAIFLKCLKQKDQIIEKLDHDLQYLSTIISYIKTGEEPQQKFNPLTKKNSFRQNSDYLINIEQSLSSIDAINSPTVRQRVKTLFQSGFKDPTTVMRAQVNTETLKKTIVKGSDSELGQSEQPQSQESANQDQEGLVESRIVKRSYFKHSLEAVRMKQIKKSQLEYFRQELIYRLIFYRLPIDKAKDYFTFSWGDDVKLSKKERRWRTHYITVRQAKQKLQKFPFELTQQKALLFARYIVEDSTKDDLFYHQENEIQRSIAKSILRAFVGEYVIPDQQQVRKELKQLFSSSGKNLNSALSSLAPTGTISAFKLLEISRGIQVDFSEECKNFILSRLAAKSPGGLNQLNYSLLFQGL